ncbi:MAG: PilZ domain-containing protein [Planctomycetota bacterium]|nr:PilZ domain-containing protein [Planctomycetota bacterium]
MNTAPPRINDTLNQGALLSQDRRRSPRSPCSVSAWVSAEPGTRGPNSQVMVSEMSLHGVGFTADAEFEPNSVHWIVLASTGLRASSRMRIASCREREDSKYDCGGEFF